MSHNPASTPSPSDLAAGLAVLADVLVRLAERLAMGRIVTVAAAQLGRSSGPTAGPTSSSG